MTNKPTDYCASGASSYRNVAPTLMALMWLAMVSFGFVFREPAPADVLMIGAIGLLIVFGPVRFSSTVIRFLAIWLTISAFGMLSVYFSPVPKDSFIHMIVSLYLAIIAIMMAAFVSEDTLRRTQLIYSGYAVAAIGTSVLAVIGYFSLLPGAYDLFTLFGRAKGGFKDPNVLGAFLPPVILLGLDRVIFAGAFRLIRGWLLAIPLLFFALLISFSRGAWMNVFIAVGVWFVLSFVTSHSANIRRRLTGLMIGGAVTAVIGVGIAFQFDSISNLATERLVAVQEYDNQRFEGQAKALELITQYPLGIGARSFNLGGFHKEDVHNVYLSMFLNAGWLGGALFLYLSFGTLIVGLRYGLIPTPWQKLFLITYASFVGVVVEGLIIDSDHWRHLYVLIGLLWGMMANMNDRQENSTQPLPAYIVSK
ncbi:MAG: O-antigen ligase family protein [Alphaproteobacteria bacterium]